MSKTWWESLSPDERQRVNNYEAYSANLGYTATLEQLLKLKMGAHPDEYGTARFWRNIAEGRGTGTIYTFRPASPYTAVSSAVNLTTANILFTQGSAGWREP